MQRRRIPPEPIITPEGALIELTKGQYALIDEADIDIVQQYIWSIQEKKHLKYAVTTIKGTARKQMFMHRYLLDFPEGDVDHINHNGLDNRRINLRIVDDRKNQANQQVFKRGASDFKGVCRASTKSVRWQASIIHDGQYHYLGIYKTEEEAAIAYDNAAFNLRGEYACLNFPRKAVMGK